MIDCIQLYLEVTNKCNLQCIHCYQGAANIQTSIQAYKAKIAISQFAEIGGKYLTLSGGETTMYKDWPSLVKLSKDLDLNTTIMTNGIDIKKHIKIIKELNVTIGFSLDAVTQNIYEKIRKAARYDQLIESLKIIEKEHLSDSVIICYTPMKLNYKDLSNLFKLIGDYGINNVYISILELRGKVLDNFEILHLNEDEKVYFLNELFFLYSRYGNKYKITISNFRGFMERIFNPNYGVTDFLDKTIRIDTSGNIYLTAYLDDGNFYIGNVKDNHIGNLWNSEMVSNAFLKAEKEVKNRCAKCEWYTICQGGSAMLAYQKHNTFTKPDDWCESKKIFLNNYYNALK